MKTATKITLLRLSFMARHLGRNIKRMFTDFAREMRDIYFFNKDNYELKQFGTRVEKNITWKWVKKEN